MHTTDIILETSEQITHPAKTLTNNNEINEVILLEGENLMYTPLKFENELRRRALIDTGACANAMPVDFYKKLKEESPISISELQQASFLNVKVASGRTVKVLAQVDVKFKVNDHNFQDSFLILPSMNSIVLGNPFFKKYNTEISPGENLLKLPEMTYQLNEIRIPKEGRRKIPKSRYLVFMYQKTTVKPQNQETLYTKIEFSKNLEGHTGMIIPLEEYENSTELKLSSSVVTVGKDNMVSILALNLNDHSITFPKKKQVAVLQFLSPQEEKKLIEIGPELLALDKMKNGDILNQINQLLQVRNNRSSRQPKRPSPEYEKIWFPTPETCQNPENLPPLQRKIFDNISELQQRDSLNPQDNEKDKETFLKQFDWSKSSLNAAQTAEMQHLLNEYYDIFAEHRFDVGYNTELKVKLPPAHDLPVYAQSPPTPIHLRDEILVELALMQYYGIVTLLPNSRYSSPIFAQRKPSGKLRILNDLRRVNHLLRNDYSDNNFPISNMTDAVHHFAGKTLFTKLDCSQAYHCVQMADPLSVQLLSFNFASRTYAYTRLAQGLNKSVTGFSSIVRSYLDSCLAANLCTQFMDDIGCGVETFEQMIPTQRQIIDSLRKSGVQLTPHKCEFEMTSINFLGNIITPQELKPETEKIEKFLKTMKLPATVRQVKRLVGFVLFSVQFYQIWHKI